MIRDYPDVNDWFKFSCYYTLNQSNIYAVLHLLEELFIQRQQRHFFFLGGINQMPASSVYGLAKTIGWSAGKTHGAIKRLEKDGLIKVEQVVAGGRVKLVIRPTPWQEFFTEAELDEMRHTGYFDEVEAILNKESR